MKPIIGRIVIYRSKIDNGPGNDVLSPAIILRTRDTTVPAVVERWGAQPRTVRSATDPTVTHETSARPESFRAELPDDNTVDLLVFGLGRDYREYAVSLGDGLGEWSWPQVARGYESPATGGILRSSTGGNPSAGVISALNAPQVPSGPAMYESPATGGILRGLAEDNPSAETYHGSTAPRPVNITPDPKLGKSFP